MKNQKRVCRVCRKKIDITVKHDGIIDSKEGVLFKYGLKNGAWFCNECWDKIIKHYKKWKKNK